MRVPLLGPLTADRRVMRFADRIPGQAGGPCHLDRFILQPSEMFTKRGDLFEHAAHTQFDVVH